MATTDITNAAFKRAESRTVREQNSGRAIKATYDVKTKRIVVDLNTGLRVSFPTGEAEGLCDASAHQLGNIQITPSGLGLPWPRLDADLYLPALLDGLLGSKKWLAAILGAAGSGVRSNAKAESARENGKRGGRPRNVAAS